MWCPGPGCSRAVEFVGCTGDATDVFCECAHGFCWSCGEEAHRPLSCVTVRAWLAKNVSYSETANWVLTHTKHCPKYRRPIEKNQGCNNMTCRPPCNHRFCWICLQSYGRSHIVCDGNRARPDKVNAGGGKDERRREQAKASLDRYLYHYERWAANHTSLQKVFKDMADLERSGLRSGFLNKAYEQVADCRRVLRWAHAYGYFLDPKRDAIKRNLFDQLQKDANMSLERLHGCAEVERMELCAGDAADVAERYKSYKKSFRASPSRRTTAAAAVAPWWPWRSAAGGSSAAFASSGSAPGGRDWPGAARTTTVTRDGAGTSTRPWATARAACRCGARTQPARRPSYAVANGADRDRYVLRSYVELSGGGVKWCPAAGCTRTLELVGDGADVFCECAQGFCWSYGEEAHRPVSCGTVRAWRAKNISDSETANWVLTHTKHCPKCRRPIEKNHGCSHMTCRAPCYHQFCWLCFDPWRCHLRCSRFDYTDYLQQDVDGEGGEEERRRRRQAKASLDSRRRRGCIGEVDDPSDEYAVEEETKAAKPTYNVLTDDIILARQEKDTATVAEVLSIPQAFAAVLLRHFKWGASQVQDEWFSDDRRVRDAVGLQPADDGGGGVPVVAMALSSRRLVCGICFVRFSAGRTRSAGCCSHYYCDACWCGYVHAAMGHGARCLSLLCPDPACSAAVVEELVNAVADGADRDRYALRSYVELSGGGVKWCPAAGCTRALDLVGDGADVFCECAHGFCWCCGEEAHRPVSCGTLQQDVDGEGGEERRRRRQAKASLDRYLYHYERWAGNGKSLQKALADMNELRSSGLEKMAASLEIQVEDLEFLIMAYEMIAYGRRVMRWVYAYGYYLDPGHDVCMRHLFDRLQDDANRWLEDLHHPAEVERMKFCSGHAGSVMNETYRAYKHQLIDVFFLK
ncbi:unnamed protein product [Miscanthus lutarioriparius]|uniref:RBR-type E3 ubiquitin transferase n=1 Tax=Miscanthus lutarioriparius TaxID=422564 RepID=A0A811Q4D2_9POAL|nr:unnamed protein product [Miscanthus lutarioriparius]